MNFNRAKYVVRRWAPRYPPFFFRLVCNMFGCCLFVFFSLLFCGVLCRCDDVTDGEKLFKYGFGLPHDSFPSFSPLRPVSGQQQQRGIDSLPSLSVWHKRVCNEVFMPIFFFFVFHILFSLLLLLLAVLFEFAFHTLGRLSPAHNNSSGCLVVRMRVCVWARSLCLYTHSTRNEYNVSELYIIHHPIVRVGHVGDKHRPVSSSFLPLHSIRNHFFLRLLLFFFIFYFARGRPTFLLSSIRHHHLGIDISNGKFCGDLGGCLCVCLTTTENTLGVWESGGEWISKRSRRYRRIPPILSTAMPPPRQQQQRETQQQQNLKIRFLCVCVGGGSVVGCREGWQKEEWPRKR